MPDTQTTPSTAQPIQFLTADLYTLTGGGLHVSYATSSIAGPPKFTYQDHVRTLSFTGSEITTTSVPDIGTIVSVTIVRTVDSGSTTFSLLLPAVQLPVGSGTSSMPVTTYGITTVHRFSVIVHFNQGQREFYTPTLLTGTAAHVVF